MFIQRHKRGFTLVELLVVIGIIAVLIGILLPSLIRVRSASRGTKCLANLRNLANMEAVFMASNRGEITTDITQGLFSSNGRSISSGTYDPRLAMCPEFSVSVPLQGSLGGYNWSQWVTWVKGSPNPKRVIPGKIKNVSEIVLFGDVPVHISMAFGNLSYGTDGLSDPFGLISTRSIAKLTQPTFAGRHGGVGAVLWMDGHATLERPVKMPYDDPMRYTGLKKSIRDNREQNIGYLVRSSADFDSLAGLYYFAFNKSLILSQTDPAVVVDLKKSGW